MKRNDKKMKITYKQDDYDKIVYCNKAKTKLTLSRNYGMWYIFFENTELTCVGYLDDAKKVVEKLLNIGIGRNFAEERL